MCFLAKLLRSFGSKTKDPIKIYKGCFGVRTSFGVEICLILSFGTNLVLEGLSFFAYRKFFREFCDTPSERQFLADSSRKCLQAD